MSIGNPQKSFSVESVGYAYRSAYQIETGCGRAAHIILNNSDTVVLIGASALSDLKYFAKQANNPVHDMLDMLELPLFSSRIVRRSAALYYDCCHTGN